MDFGLYNLKYPFRQLVKGTLPWLRNVNPNTISWLLIPVGLAIAESYYIAAHDHAIFYLICIILIILRMFLGTIDGLMAEHFNKQSDQGEIINRLTPEISDIFYLIALTLARPEWLLLGILTIAIAWLTSFSGLIGLAVNRPIQSIGPVGQTDRLAALIVFTLLAYLAERFAWPIDFIRLFLMWCILGGMITIYLRLKRNLTNTNQS